jgi:hypothetical protein
MIAADVWMLALRALVAASDTDGDECFDTILETTSIATVAIPRPVTGDHATVVNARAGETTNRGVYARHVDLPRGREREIVRERKRSYELNGRGGRGARDRRGLPRCPGQ